MHFSNHEQVETIVLSGLKILKSRYQGLYVGYAQRIKLKDSMIADNGYGIEFRWAFIWCTDSVCVFDLNTEPTR